MGIGEKPCQNAMKKTRNAPDGTIANIVGKKETFGKVVHILQHNATIIYDKVGRPIGKKDGGEKERRNEIEDYKFVLCEKGCLARFHIYS
jgi:hypothetical protein